MGLDLYAGTFTRYYTRNWKTVVEAWAEANGVDFKRTETEDEEKLSPEEVQEIVCAWRDEMLQAVTPENQLPANAEILSVATITRRSSLMSYTSRTLPW